MIDDLRFMIAGGHAGCIENFCQFFGFNAQFGQSFGRQQTGALNQINPERRFIRFFQNNGDFIDEISARFSAKRGAVIGRHRTAAARHLICNCSARDFIRQRIREFQNAHGKLHRSFFEFSRIHK
jgi:hypothetical protein